MIFSPLLEKKEVPDTLWLPPEIRSMLGGPKEEPVDMSTESVLKAKLDCLIDRISHVESLAKQLDVEGRLRRLEISTEQNMEKQKASSSASHETVTESTPRPGRKVVRRGA